MPDVRVCIVMGSKSDYEMMKGAAEALARFGVGYAIHVCSAHRTPGRLHELIAGYEKGGCEVYIAAAGGAAHLPGVVASLTNRPVIGVPVKSGALSGVDSLYAIVQMPKGVPVATVAIDGSWNAGLLAVQMLSLADKNLAGKYQEYRTQLREDVMAQDAQVRELDEKGH